MSETRMAKCFFLFMAGAVAILFTAIFISVHTAEHYPSCSSYEPVNVGDTIPGRCAYYFGITNLPQ